MFAPQPTIHYRDVNIADLATSFPGMKIEYDEPIRLVGNASGTCAKIINKQNIILVRPSSGPYFPAVILESTGGNIEITGPASDVKITASTHAGDIKADHIGPGSALSTNKGDISVKSAGPGCILDANQGDIHARSVDAHAELNTVIGNIFVKTVGENSKLGTSHGDIHAQTLGKASTLVAHAGNIYLMNDVPDKAVLMGNNITCRNATGTQWTIHASGNVELNKTPERNPAGGCKITAFNVKMRFLGPGVAVRCDNFAADMVGAVNWQPGYGTMQPVCASGNAAIDWFIKGSLHAHGHVYYHRKTDDAQIRQYAEPDAPLAPDLKQGNIHGIPEPGQINRWWELLMNPQNASHGKGISGR